MSRSTRSASSPSRPANGWRGEQCRATADFLSFSNPVPLVSLLPASAGAVSCSVEVSKLLEYGASTLRTSWQEVLAQDSKATRKLRKQLGRHGELAQLQLNHPWLPFVHLNWRPRKGRGRKLRSRMHTGTSQGIGYLVGMQGLGELMRVWKICDAHTWGAQRGNGRNEKQIMKRRSANGRLPTCLRNCHLPSQTASTETAPRNRTHTDLSSCQFSRPARWPPENPPAVGSGPRNTAKFDHFWGFPLPDTHLVHIGKARLGRKLGKLSQNLNALKISSLILY